MKLFKYRWLNHVLFWIVIFSFFTVPRVVAYGFTIDAFVNLIYLPLDIIAVYILIEFLIPQYIFRKRNLLIFSLGALLTIALNIAVSYYIMYHIQPTLGFWVRKMPFIYELFNFLVNNLMIIGTASALKLFSYSHRIQVVKSELEKRSVQSELGILRSQVNPHFLFNVLNNIDALIFEDREKASNAIFLLSKIMRYMLNESIHEQVMLKMEITYIKDYLELAKLSFEDPDFVAFNLTGQTENKKIPPLLFIPIIENAIKHCNKQSKIPGVNIEFNIEEEFIELKTSNYIKQNDFKLPDSGTGTGLKNVEKRLKLLHNENYTFNVKQNMDKFNVYLKVPLS
jgi:sensor histidine kinase YesM